MGDAVSHAVMPGVVVAYALAGHMELDLYKDPLGKNKKTKH